jgi:hypothetical protein
MGGRFLAEKDQTTSPEKDFSWAFIMVLPIDKNPGSE